MLTRKLVLSLVAVAAVAAPTGCVAPYDEPITVAGRVTCHDVAGLTGLDLGNRAFVITEPTARTYEIDQYNAIELTLRPTETGDHLEWSASMGVVGIVVARTNDRAAAAGGADELLAPDVEPRPIVSHVYLRDPVAAGWAVLPASLDPRTKRPIGVIELQVCLDR